MTDGNGNGNGAAVMSLASLKPIILAAIGAAVPVILHNLHIRNWLANEPEATAAVAAICQAAIGGG